jgi:hypothetical protein
MLTNMDLIGKSFDGLGDRELPLELADANVQDCKFNVCRFGKTAHLPAERRIVRNIHLRNCTASASCSFGPVIFDEVTVEGLKTTGLVIVYGAVYRHVTLRGRCGKLFLNQLPDDRRPLFEPADRAFYEKVDWALDISDGEFDELDIRDIPADLIRRDPESQVIARRRTAEATRAIWQRMDFRGTTIGVALSNMLDLDLPDQVIVAPKRDKLYKEYLAIFKHLRSEGVLELG